MRYLNVQVAVQPHGVVPHAPAEDQVEGLLVLLELGRHVQNVLLLLERHRERVSLHDAVHAELLRFRRVRDVQHPTQLVYHVLPKPHPTKKKIIQNLFTSGNLKNPGPGHTHTNFGGLGAVPSFTQPFDSTILRTCTTVVALMLTTRCVPPGSLNICLFAFLPAVMAVISSTLGTFRLPPYLNVFLRF